MGPTHEWVKRGIVLRLYENLLTANLIPKYTSQSLLVILDISCLVSLVKKQSSIIAMCVIFFLYNVDNPLQMKIAGD